MKKIFKILTKSKVNNYGVTLVELVVTFALMGLFMVAATNVMMSAINIYYEVKGSSYGLEISSILEKKIVREISLADNGNLSVYGENQPCSNSSIVIYNEGHCIDYLDKSGDRTRISVDDKGYINYHYYAVEDENASEATVLSGAYDWKYDKKMYMGYKIKDLTFSKADSSVYKSNIIVMNLVLFSDKYGEYKTTKYIECFNFDNSSVNSSIVVK